MRNILANKQQWFLGLLLLSGVGISTYLMQSSKVSVLPHVSARLLQHRQFFMLNVDSHKTDMASGAVSMRLHAPRVTRTADADYYTIQQPHVITYRQGQMPTNITSHYATAVSNFSYIDLIGQVRIDQAASKTQPRNKLRTSKLRYYPNKNVASSQQKVYLWQGASKMSGIGLRADLTHNQMSLLSDVQGEYATNDS